MFITTFSQLEANCKANLVPQVDLRIILMGLYTNLKKQVSMGIQGNQKAVKRHNRILISIRKVEKLLSE